MGQLKPRCWPAGPASAGSTIAGRCRRPGTQIGQRTRAHVRPPRAQRQAGLARRARQRRPAPARATSAMCPDPAAATADRHQDETPRPHSPASAPHSTTSATSPAVEPAPGTNPAGSNPRLDRPQWRHGRPRPPAVPPRPRPAAANHPEWDHRNRRPIGHAGQDPIRSIKTAPTPCTLPARSLPDRTQLAARPTCQDPRGEASYHPQSDGARWCCTPPRKGVLPVALLSAPSHDQRPSERPLIAHQRTCLCHADGGHEPD